MTERLQLIAGVPRVADDFPYPNGDTDDWALSFADAVRNAFDVLQGRVALIGEESIWPLRAITTAYTLTDDDRVVLADATGGAFDVILPTAVGRTGRIFHIKRVNGGGNAVTINPVGTETIDESLNDVLSIQYESRMVISDGTEWWNI